MVYFSCLVGVPLTPPLTYSHCPARSVVATPCLSWSWGKVLSVHVSVCTRSLPGKAVSLCELCCGGWLVGSVLSLSGPDSGPERGACTSQCYVALVFQREGALLKVN